MDSVVLDTDVLSFLAKADTRAARYLPELKDRRLCVCFQTVAELRLWVLVRRWGQSRRAALESFLTQFIVLPYDAMMAQTWAEITAHRRHLGRPIDCGDAWIGDCALRHNSPLVTHNSKHYLDIPGLTLISHAQ